MPLIGIAEPGEVVVRNGGGTTSMAVTGGFIEVSTQKLVLLADSAQRFDELDEKIAEEAREKAEKLMSEKLTEREMAETSAMLQKSLLHIKLLRRKRTRRSL